MQSSSAGPTGAWQRRTLWWNSMLALAPSRQLQVRPILSAVLTMICGRCLWLPGWGDRSNTVVVSHAGSLGGTEITLSGSGFGATAAENRVVLGGQECEITSVTSSQIVCRAPESSSDATFAVALYIGDVLSPNLCECSNGLQVRPRALAAACMTSLLHACHQVESLPLFHGTVSMVCRPLRPRHAAERCCQS